MGLDLFAAGSITPVILPFKMLNTSLWRDACSRNEGRTSGRKCRIPQVPQPDIPTTHNPSVSLVHELAKAVAEPLHFYMFIAVYQMYICKKPGVTSLNYHFQVNEPMFDQLSYLFRGIQLLS